MSHDYYTSWSKILSAKEDVDSFESDIGISAKTLGLYQGFIKNHHKNALKKMFSRLGEIRELDWDNISRDYYKKYPARSWDLNDISYAFKDYANEKLFLDDDLKSALLELIEYSLNEFKCFREDHTLDMESKFYQINPTYKVSQFEYDIALWVKEMDAATGSKKNISPKKNPNILLITRDLNTHLCKFTKVGALEVAIFEIISQVEVHKENISLLEYHLSEMIGPIENQALKKTLAFLAAQSIIF